MRYLMLATALMIGSSALAQETVTPENADPARDARGIPVISTPGVAPPGANEPVPSGPVVPAPNEEAVFAPKPSTIAYPPCSPTVTDNCVQTYQRGLKPG